MKSTEPQLFDSRRFFGFHSVDWQYGSSGVGEMCLSLQGVIPPTGSEGDCFILGASMLMRSEILSFVETFTDAPTRFLTTLADDFGVTSPESLELISGLLKQITEKAEKLHGGFYIPIPSFYCIFLVEYLAFLVPYGRGGGSLEQQILPRLSEQVLSESSVPRSALDKLVVPLNASIRSGIEGNPNCSEEAKVMYAMKYGKLNLSS